MNAGLPQMRLFLLDQGHRVVGDMLREAIGRHRAEEQGVQADDPTA